MKTSPLLVVILLLTAAAPSGWADPPPARGALVSELREQVAEGAEGGGMVIRLYEDASGTQIREFLLRGQPFQMEIRPSNGAPPYYLVDPNGKGLFESHDSSQQGPQLLVPQWIFSRF
ncbi:MAG: DUF2782 domain-containing protein [Magnetococcales bacterium]|nr:DUF2782 domain-containing protein [Magnetococcales bacterium]